MLLLALLALGYLALVLFGLALLRVAAGADAHLNLMGRDFEQIQRVIGSTGRRRAA
jgi:hypothetical protein